MADAESITTPKTRDRAKELRRSQTPQETVLWHELRSRRASGFKFRRQHPVGPFILDFFCMRAMLAVELDGWVHEDIARQATTDERRSRWLDLHGEIKVIRFTNDDVVLDVGKVCDEIVRIASERIADFERQRGVELDRDLR